MTSTVACLLESEASFNLSTISENTKAFRNVEELPEDIKGKLGYTLEKVNILRDNDNDKYFIEYSDNLERYMKDQGIGLEEAVTNICEHYSIFQDDVAIVLDESCVDKIDMVSLVENFTVYKK